MDIRSHEGNFVHKLYDKRNDFGFKVISLPNLVSNIPINQAYGTFYSQVVRYFKAINDFDNFVYNVKYLIDKLCKQNFNRRVLHVYLKRFISKFEFSVISKYLTRISLSNFTN